MNSHSMSQSRPGPDLPPYMYIHQTSLTAALYFVLASRNSGTRVPLGDSLEGAGHFCKYQTHSLFGIARQ